MPLSLLADQTYNGKELLAQIAAGDEDAFAMLVHRHWKPVYSQALTYLKSRQVAEEITQDVFVKVWGARRELPGLQSFEGYIRIVCRNTVFDELRKHLRTPLRDLLQDQVEQVLQPDKQLEFREYNHQLMALIEQLPEKRREVFKLSRLEGKSHEEIASLLSIHKDTVSQYIIKALNFLRTHFAAGQADLILICLLLDIAL